MPDDVRHGPHSVFPLSPQDIAERSFPTSFRGYEPDEVRSFLKRVGREMGVLRERQHELEQRLELAEQRAAHPELDVGTLTRLLGEETARILSTAQEAARDVRARAEENVAQLLREAHVEARRIRGEAEGLLARQSAEAEQAAAEIRAEAAAEVQQQRDGARQEAEALLDDANRRAQALVEEAGATRSRILRDLNRRRRLGQLQVEQLRAGRDRLLEAYRVVRATLDEVTEELERSQQEAREAAEAVAARFDGLPDDDDVRGEDGAHGDALSLDEVPPGRSEHPSAGGASAPDRIDAGARAGVRASEPDEAAGRATAPPEPDDPEDAAGGPTHLRMMTNAAEGAATPAEPVEAQSPVTSPTTPPHRRVPIAPPLPDRPADEARQASLRIIRRTRPAVSAAPPTPPAPPGEVRAVPARGELTAVEPPAPDEEVRLMRGRPEEPPNGDAFRAPGEATAERAAARDVGASEAGVGRPGDEQATSDEPEPLPEDEQPPGAAEEPLPEEVEPDRGGPPALADDSGSRTVPGGDQPAAPAGRPTAGAPANVDVSELFARIRADRAGTVARAREVLAEPVPRTGGAPAATLAPPESARRTGEQAPDAPAADHAPRAPQHREVDAAGAATGDQETAVPDGDERLLQRRDAVLEDLESRLTRKLKRALQDEQNDLLDRLRSRPQDGAALIPSEDEQATRLFSVARELLEAAAGAGVAFAGAPEMSVPVEDLLASLATDLGAPLRRRLARTLAEGAGDDQAQAVERVGAAYRETKSQRVERLAGDHLVAAFSRGTFLAVPAGAPVRWMVDDAGGPCPDCDDNALAGSVERGEAFPTGQPHPPAHGGCRCLLVPPAP